MRICINRRVSIRGLQGDDPAAARLLDLLGPDLVTVIRRLVTQEVTRNLRTREQVRPFHRLFRGCDSAAADMASCLLFATLPTPRRCAKAMVESVEKEAAATRDKEAGMRTLAVECSFCLEHPERVLKMCERYPGDFSHVPGTMNGHSAGWPA